MFHNKYKTEHSRAICYICTRCTMLKDTRKYQAHLAVILFPLLFQVHRGISAGTAVPPIQHFLLLIIEDTFTWMFWKCWIDLFQNREMWNIWKLTICWMVTNFAGVQSSTAEDSYFQVKHVKGFKLSIFHLLTPWDTLWDFLTLFHSLHRPFLCFAPPCPTEDRTPKF